MSSKVFWDRLAVRSQLPGEVLPGRSLVEIVGGSRVLVEYHRGLLCYSKERVLIRSAEGRVAVEGSDLRIESISRQQMLICGKIQSVLLEKGSS